MHPTQSRLLELAQKKDLGTLTLREIAAEVNEKYAQSVKHHLEQLIKKGLAKKDANGSVSVVKKGRADDTNLYALPIYGSANCGPATIFADQSIKGFLKVSQKLLPSKKKSLYALKAVGSSLNKANIKGDSIEDGDYVIVDPEARNPKNGDYIIAAMDGSANMKKFVREPRRVLLISESTEDYPPIVLHIEDQYDSLICGTIVSVIKNPK